MPLHPVDPLPADYDGDADSGLREQGWDRFLRLGDDTSHMWITTWRKKVDGGAWTYLIEVNDPAFCSPYLQSDDFVEIMDAVARWAPAVQAAAVNGLVDELMNTDVSAEGIVEALAARAVHGAEVALPYLLKQQKERQELRRQMRAASRP